MNIIIIFFMKTRKIVVNIICCLEVQYWCTIDWTYVLFEIRSVIGTMLT